MSYPVAINRYGFYFRFKVVHLWCSIEFLHCRFIFLLNYICFCCLGVHMENPAIPLAKFWEMNHLRISIWTGGLSKDRSHDLFSGIHFILL